MKCTCVNLLCLKVALAAKEKEAMKSCPSTSDSTVKCDESRPFINVSKSKIKMHCPQSGRSVNTKVINPYFSLYLITII